MPKILRGMLSLVRMWRTAVVTIVRAFPQTCYYEDDEITNIVGLVPPTPVMLGKLKKGQKQRFGPKGELNHIAELITIGMVEACG